MKRVGIITFHAAHNNGSFLQAYALQSVIQSFEQVECEIIDFQTNWQNEFYAIFKKNNHIYNIIKNMISALHYTDLKHRYKNFEKMRKDYLNLSEEQYTLVDELSCIEEKYDAFVCGSDQIWNFCISDFNIAYFLPSVSKKIKISYAPSFGNNTEIIRKNSLYEKINTLLKDFSEISAREESGRSLIQDASDRIVSVCIDPTLLLNSDHYDIISSPVNIKSEYIFFYSISYNDNIAKNVQKISQALGLKVVTVFTGTLKAHKFKKYGFRVMYDVGPDKFLFLIKNAKYVLSTSFHGVAFSIIYKKNFWVLSEHQNDFSLRDERMYSLLKKLDLTDRILTQCDNCSDMLPTNIDYETVNGLLNQEKAKSLQFLKDGLKTLY